MLKQTIARGNGQRKDSNSWVCKHVLPVTQTALTSQHCSELLTEAKLRSSKTGHLALYTPLLLSGAHLPRACQLEAHPDEKQSPMLVAASEHRQRARPRRAVKW